MNSSTSAPAKFQKKKSSAGVYVYAKWKARHGLAESWDSGANLATSHVVTAVTVCNVSVARCRFHGKELALRFKRTPTMKGESQSCSAKKKTSSLRSLISMASLAFLRMTFFSNAKIRAAKIGILLFAQSTSLWKPTTCSPLGVNFLLFRVSAKCTFSYHQLHASACLTRRRGRELVHRLYSQNLGYVYQPPISLQNPNFFLPFVFPCHSFFSLFSAVSAPKTTGSARKNGFSAGCSKRHYSAGTISTR